jgi:hypothetical protein
MPGMVAAPLAAAGDGDTDSWDAGVFGWLGLAFLPCQPPGGVFAGISCLGLEAIGLRDRRGVWVIKREAESGT